LRRRARQVARGCHLSQLLWQGHSMATQCVCFVGAALAGD
jgi:hypothetical protein